MDPVMRIDLVIHIDFLCPWCYLNKRSLEVAMGRFLARRPGVEFDVQWKPFLIHPQVQKGPKLDLYTNTMSYEPINAYLARLSAAGARTGLTFSLAGSTGPTQRAHRIAAATLARHGGPAQTAVVETLFRGYFVEGRDISDDAWLRAVARQAGVGDDDVRAADVWSLAVEVASAGVKSVPRVTAQGSYVVGGFQESEVFERLFERIWRENGGEEGGIGMVSWGGYEV